jgi:hypothetical protein
MGVSWPIAGSISGGMPGQVGRAISTRCMAISRLRRNGAITGIEARL